MSAVLSLVQTEIPPATTTLGYRNFSQIPADAYPYAMAYGRTGARDRPIPYESRSVDTFLLVIVVKDEEQPEQIADSYRETIEAALRADPTVGGEVPYAYVSEFATVPEIDTPRASAAMTITLERQTGDAVLIRWIVDVAVELNDGAVTVAAYLSAVNAALVTALSGTRLVNDLGDPLEAIAEGTTRYQLAHVGPTVRPPSRSNPTNVKVMMRLTVWRHQAASASERDYTEGPMDAEVSTVVDDEFWRVGLDAVEVTEPADLSFPEDLERI